MGGEGPYSCEIVSNQSAAFARAWFITDNGRELKKENALVTADVKKRDRLPDSKD